MSEVSEVLMGQLINYLLFYWNEKSVAKTA